MNINQTNNIQLSVQNQSISPSQDFNIDVKLGKNDSRQPEKTFEQTYLIPPEEITTDFPDSNIKPNPGEDPYESGNSMICLQNALFGALNIDSSGMSEVERVDAFKEIIDNKKVTDIRGKYLKNGDRADSPPIADVYHDELTGKSYFKYLVTWEIDVETDEGPVTLRKKQWVVTGVEIPARYNSPKFVRQKLYFAFLSLKLHLSTHKAALDPQHEHHMAVNSCIKDLMRTNLCGHEGYVGQNRLGFISYGYDKKVASFKPSDTVSADHKAQTLAIVLKDDDGKKTVLFHNQVNSARKLSADGLEYTKEKVSDKDEDYVRLLDKRFSSALKTVFRFPDFAAHQKIMKADPKEVLDLIQASQEQGKNLRGLTTRERAEELLGSITSLHKTIRENAQKEQESLFNEIFAAYIQKREKVIQALLYSIGLKSASFNHLKSCMNDLKFDELSQTEQERIRKLREKYRETVRILKRNEERASIINLHYLKESLSNQMDLSDAALEHRLRRIDALEDKINNGEFPKSSLLKKHEKAVNLFDGWIS